MDVNAYVAINKKHLSEGLRWLRKSHNLKLDDLSFSTGKDVGYLSRLENGKIFPKIDTLSTILAHYELTIKEFYDKLDELRS